MEKLFNTLYSKNESTIFKSKRERDFDKRRNESERIRQKYPDRVPVICERSGTNISDIDKKKYLVPGDLTLGQFIYVIRRRIKLSPNLGLFLFVGEEAVIPNNTTLMSSCFAAHADEDGFLYVTYSGENTFG